MATLFRHSRSIVSRLATAGRTTTFSANGSTIAVQSAAKKSLPADAIRPKPAGDVHYMYVSLMNEMKAREIYDVTVCCLDL